MYHYIFLGSCYIVINPINLTTCLNSSAIFTCTTNEQTQIFWLINGHDPLFYSIKSPGSFYNISGPGTQSTLNLPGLYLFDGASVTCQYSSSSTQYQSSALLRVQGISIILHPYLVQ